MELSESLIIFLRNEENVRLFQTIQAILTIVAILVGGFWTYLLFVKKRQKYPAANTSHCVSNRPIIDGKVLLRVVTNISNDGNVLLSLESGLIRVQQVRPVSEELAESLNGEKYFEEAQTEISWPLLEERPFSFKKKEREIEPGETDEFCFDFILAEEVETILIYTYYKNKKRKRREIGWNMSSFYNLSQGS